MATRAKRTRVDAAMDSMGEAKAELDARQKALDEREAALNQREGSLAERESAAELIEHERQLMAGQSPSDVIPLNIGGTKCHALRRTLCLYEKSMLAARFSGRWDESIEKDADGYYFIDQPYELFKPLLNFLRAKAIAEPGCDVIPPYLKRAKDSDPDRDEPGPDPDWWRMLMHYGMTNFVYPVYLVPFDGLGECVEGSVTSGAEPTMECTEPSTFLLAPCAHGYSSCMPIVKSFVVVLDSDVEDPQIGWADRTRKRPRDVMEGGRWRIEGSERTSAQSDCTVVRECVARERWSRRCPT